MGVSPTSIFDTTMPRIALGPGIWLGANWYHDSSPIWSRGRSCSLLIDPLEIPAPRVLVMGVVVFNATRNAPKVLRIDSDGHPSVEVEVPNTQQHNIVVKSPHPASDVAFGKMRFQLDSVESPAKLGLSSDGRLLGLQIVSFVPLMPELTLPLDFSLETNRNAFLREGWETSEPGGTWSSGQEARIVLPFFLHKDRQALSFDFEVLPRPKGVDPLAITVEIGGSKLDPWICTADQPGPRLCPLPSIRPDGRDLEINLRIQNPLPPRELSINEDPRPLGLRLKKIYHAPEKQFY